MALLLFNECKKIEISGGILVTTQHRRRTPGGVYLHLFKSNDKISIEVKVRIFDNIFFFKYM